MRDIVERLRYHYNCISNTVPSTLNGIEHTIPVAANILRWLEDGDCLLVDDNDPRVAKMYDTLA